MVTDSCNTCETACGSCDSGGGGCKSRCGVRKDRCGCRGGLFARHHARHADGCGCDAGSCCDDLSTCGTRNGFFNKFVGAEYGRGNFQTSFGGTLTGVCGCNATSPAISGNVQNANPIQKTNPSSWQSGETNYTNPQSTTSVVPNSGKSLPELPSANSKSNDFIGSPVYEGVSGPNNG